MNLGSLIVIFFLSLAFEFIYSRMSKVVKGEKPIKGSRSRPVRKERPRRQVQEGTVENRTSIRAEPVNSIRQPRKTADNQRKPAGGGEAFEPSFEEEQGNVSPGTGLDILDEDSLIKGIIISEILQPPLCRRQNRKGR